MEKICDSKIVQEQYKNAASLNTRISIHEKYSYNKKGFGNWIFEHYQIKPSYSILELGCGNGIIWKDNLSKLPSNICITLTDISEGMLDEAKNNLADFKNINFQQIDIQDIPFQDNSFDMVIGNMMLYHIPDLRKGLSEVQRVLSQKGKFYCATYGIHGITEYIQDLLVNYGMKHELNRVFTLQNGKTILKNFFNTVEQHIYEDYLEITNLDDFIEYIETVIPMVDIEHVNLREIRSILENRMVNDSLHVPKEYGLFIASKG